METAVPMQSSIPQNHPVQSPLWVSAGPESRFKTVLTEGSNGSTGSPDPSIMTPLERIAVTPKFSMLPSSL